MSNSTRLPKYLSDTDLDEHWDWYETWCADDDEIPELDEEDYETICNIIEELFQYIHYLKGKDNCVDDEMLDALSDLRKGVGKLENRKRKAIGSNEAGESKRKKRHYSRK